MSRFCGYCGSTLADNATFCPNCGASATEQPMQQYNQPQQFYQPVGMGAPAVKKGMSKGAKIAIFCSIGAVVVGLVIWLIIALVGGGYKKVISDHLKAYEKSDYELFCDTLTAGGELESVTKDEISSKRSFAESVSSLNRKYGNDLSISYEIIEDVQAPAESVTTEYAQYIEEVHQLKLSITIKGSYKTDTKSTKVRVIKAGGKWFLKAEIF